jgi:hypothetical protein
MADAVLSVLNDLDTAQHLGGNAPKDARNPFDWKNMARILPQYNQLVSAGASVSSDNGHVSERVTT